VLAATSAAFVVVFAFFVAGLLALVVITLRWAVRRDRQGRAQWVERRGGPPADPDR
jgi:hypothetical protein